MSGDPTEEARGSTGGEEGQSQQKDGDEGGCSAGNGEPERDSQAEKKDGESDTDTVPDESTDETTPRPIEQREHLTTVCVFLYSSQVVTSGYS